MFTIYLINIADDFRSLTEKDRSDNEPEYVM